MNLKKLLSKESILPSLQPGSKEDILKQLVSFMTYSGKVADKESALKAVLAREAKMSTAMQHGIAIPHGKSDTVEKLAIAVGICREGTDFGSMDGEPSKIFIMTLSPANHTGPHIQFLAEISKVLTRPGLCDKLIEAKTTAEIVELLTT